MFLHRFHYRRFNWAFSKTIVNLRESGKLPECVVSIRTWGLIESLIKFIPSFITHMKTYYDNRCRMHTHILTTDLAPGVWHDVDLRITMSMFATLVHFVEDECKGSLDELNEPLQEAYHWYTIEYAQLKTSIDDGTIDPSKYKELIVEPMDKHAEAIFMNRRNLWT